MDTAAEYSVVGGALAEALQDDLRPTGAPDVRYETRLGRIVCSVQSLRFVLLADDGCGEDLILDGMTILVSRDWSGPMTLGMRGALEFIRFAVDPGASAGGDPRIYFADGA